MAPRFSSDEGELLHNWMQEINIFTVTKCNAKVLLYKVQTYNALIVKYTQILHKHEKLNVDTIIVSRLTSPSTVSYPAIYQARR